MVPDFIWLRRESEEKQFAGILVPHSIPQCPDHAQKALSSKAFLAAGGLSTYLTLLHAGKTTSSGHYFANFPGNLSRASLTRRSEASYRRSVAGKRTWKREHPERASRPRPKPGSGSTVRVGSGTAGGGVIKPGQRSRGFPTPQISSYPRKRRPRATAASPPASAASGSRAPAPSPALGARAHPSGCRARLSVRPSGRRKRSSTGGRGPRSAKPAGPGAAAQVGQGRGHRGLYRPAPRAAAALLRGSGSCTIVSGRREGGCRAPAPPPPARAIPEGPGGGGAAGSTVARSHRGRGPRVSPPAPTARRQLGFSWASASLGRGFLPFLERGSCYAPTSRK